MATRHAISQACIDRSDPILRAVLTGFAQRHLPNMSSDELEEMRAIMRMDDTRLLMFMKSGISPPTLNGNATSLTSQAVLQILGGRRERVHVTRFVPPVAGAEHDAARARAG
eukprot:CAMPEP_0170181604 /NCGR_PEP_ID=MMETSP0040_2-20121228/25562_1 /TAXON_ID=641309 /ORGANISM="Lotharella oceanica, Strain CCMP622" /LENGTH=111 /DNA_ID=CAMNT_0010426717 /DNA_START=168 /DNA_END=502 /DNA_ORIENTATION=+